jgi:predicted PurR-regulated permease PerM
MTIAVATAATIWILIVAKDVLQPVLIALFIWFLLNATSRAVGRGLLSAGVKSPLAAKATSALVVTVALLVLSIMASKSASALAAQLPAYEEKLDTLIAAAAKGVGIEQALQVSQLLERIEIAPAVLSIAGSAASFLGSTIVVLVYIVFINQEAGIAEAKLAALLAEPSKRKHAAALAEQILGEIETYIGAKVIVGLAQAIPTWIVLTSFDVNAALFWAIVIFLVSFIPTIGTMIGMIFPPLMTLLQFGTVMPALIVAATLMPVQLVASNYMEPKLLSKSLNLSPLITLFSIFVGGAIWGIIGALIVVPILAISVIVFARIPSLRPVAILLSGDGQVH